MNYFTFEYPLAIFILLPILYCLYKCKEHLLPKYFVHLHLWSPRKSYMKLEWIIKVLILVLLVVALTSPITFDRSSPYNRHGKDIVLAIDASGSMNASGYDEENDFSETKRLSRFELTKMIATEFIYKRSSDNVGVVLYGDFAFIASPITYEKEMVAEMLSYLNQGMAGQNTAIGEALLMSVRAFKHSKSKTKIVILLTDGEHNSGSISPKEATKLASENGVKIYTIAIGKEGEADQSLLETIAEQSGGDFFYASSAKELQEVYETIDSLESSKIKSQEYLVKDLYFFIALLVAMFLLIFLLVRELRR